MFMTSKIEFSPPLWLQESWPPLKSIVELKEDITHHVFLRGIDLPGKVY